MFISKKDDLNAKLMYKNLKPLLEKTNKDLLKLKKEGEKKVVDDSYSYGTQKDKKKYYSEMFYKSRTNDKRTKTGYKTIKRRLEEAHAFQDKFKEIEKPLRSRVKRIIRNLPENWKDDPELKNLDILRKATSAKYNRVKRDLEPCKDLLQIRRSTDSISKVLNSLKKLGF